MDFAGEFETHVTVSAGSDDALRTWADGQGDRRLKVTHILLDGGSTPSQPMVTRQSTGTLATERAAAATLADELTAAGFEVCRVKVEVPPRAAGIPATDADAAGHPPLRHFEHHVKLLLPADADEAAVAAAVAIHSAQLSRNARRVRPDGRRERFVTQRCYAVGLATAGRRLADLLAALAAGGYDVVDTEAEYVVFDSNAALDAGWINREGT